MGQRVPDARRFLQVIWRHGVLVGIAAGAGLLAGAVFAALSPVMVTSTALIVLPQSSPSMATAVVIAGSDPVLASALPRVSAAASLEGLRRDVQVGSLTRYIVSVSAGARTAGQAEATADAVAASYIGYISSASSPAGRIPARMLQAATTATGTVPPMQVLAGALLGVVSGALTGVTAALWSGRPTD
jgi:hypothetical protein